MVLWLSVLVLHWRLIWGLSQLRWSPAPEFYYLSGQKSGTLQKLFQFLWLQLRLHSRQICAVHRKLKNMKSNFCQWRNKSSADAGQQEFNKEVTLGFPQRCTTIFSAQTLFSIVGCALDVLQWHSSTDINQEKYRISLTARSAAGCCCCNFALISSLIFNHNHLKKKRVTESAVESLFQFWSPEVMHNLAL